MMATLSFALVVVVVLAHAYFLTLEMFLWTKPIGRKIFRLSPEFAEASRVLAANQGLYNGFLAVGLVWGLVTEQPGLVHYLLVCVVIAGIYGAMTFSKRIFWSQSAPALLALLTRFLV
jgi:putative membrane protein